MPTTTITFNPGDPITQTVTVQVNGDIKVEADETFSLNLSNANATGRTIIISDSQGVGTITNDDAPRVSGVFVRATGWVDAFRNYVDPGLKRGYLIPVGSSAQLNVLPWFNLDRIVVTFNADVNASIASLALKGVNFTNYPIASFSYDAATFTATWVLGQVIQNDRLLIDLDGDGASAVRSVIGNIALDGNWTNSSSTYPSGDGVPADDFKFRFNVLAGDVNNTGTVFGSDVILVRNAQFTDPGDAGYSIFYDVNGSANIFGSDVILVRNAQFTSLPTGEPLGMVSPTSAANTASVVGSVPTAADADLALPASSVPPSQANPLAVAPQVSAAALALPFNADRRETVAIASPVVSVDAAPATVASFAAVTQPAVASEAPVAAAGLVGLTENRREAAGEPASFSTVGLEASGTSRPAGPASLGTDPVLALAAASLTPVVSPAWEVPQRISSFDLEGHRELLGDPVSSPAATYEQSQQAVEWRPAVDAVRTILVGQTILDSRFQLFEVIEGLVAMPVRPLDGLVPARIRLDSSSVDNALRILTPFEFGDWKQPDRLPASQADRHGAEFQADAVDSRPPRGVGLLGFRRRRGDRANPLGRAN